jgi:hypothetical protein
MVVGNSGHLLRSQHGKAIDAHDVVGTRASHSCDDDDDINGPVPAMRYPYGHVTKQVVHQHGHLTEHVMHQYGHMTKQVVHQHGHLTKRAHVSTLGAGDAHQPGAHGGVREARGMGSNMTMHSTEAELTRLPPTRMYEHSP